MKPICTAVLLFSAAAAAAEPAPPELRLPDSVRPIRQSVDLTLDPEGESFTGTVEIDLDVRAAVPLIWLNARELDIREATLVLADGPVAARIVPGGDDFVGFALEEPIGAGTVELRVSFGGRISRREIEGVFTMREAEDWYLYTHFQPLAARQAFPCFDEPEHKIPWGVTLRVPAGLVALSNAPAAESHDEEGSTVVVFRETRPLPSYLVAFAVGPFDLVDLGPIGRHGTPGRLAVPKGRAADTDWAGETTSPILSLLEGHFDRPYPYAKLDQVAIPGVGYAMEHPGLVSYGQGLMVQRGEEQTTAGRRDWVIYCAHELAHMWFGNLVTMQWWDDTWLNEAFAMWMETRIAAELRPDWGMELTRVEDRAHALNADSLSTARQIRQPIEGRHDIATAFDTITYYKGKAVLEMVEAWLGKDVFRRGVTRYMGRHAWGNARAEDFFEALSEAAGKDVTPAVSTFIDQNGAPLITARRACGEEPHLALKQEPYRPLGSAPSGEKSWQVPVCAAFPEGHERGTGCTLLGERTGELVLGAGRDCPEWALANAGVRGYYRLAVTAEDARRLLGGAHLTVAERLGVASDLAALVASGDLAAGDVLELVPLLANDAHPRVVGAAVDLMDELESVVPDARMEEYASLVRRILGPRARELGWSAGVNEDEETRLLRPRVVRFVGVEGADEVLGAEAAERARRWLEDPGGVDPDMVETVLAVAARHAAPPLYERLETRALAEADRQTRTRILTSLGALRDPALARRAVGLLLDERVDHREALRLARGLSLGRDTRRLLWELLEENWDAVAGRLSRGALAYLPYFARPECEAARKRELEAWLAPRVKDVDGGPRRLEQALEQIDQCVARRAAQQGSAVEFLERELGGPGVSG